MRVCLSCLNVGLAREYYLFIQNWVMVVPCEEWVEEKFIINNLRGDSSLNVNFNFKQK